MVAAAGKKSRGGCGRGEGGAEVVAAAEKEEQRWRRRVEEEQGWPHAQRRSRGGRKICVLVFGWREINFRWLCFHCA